MSFQEAKHLEFQYTITWPSDNAVVFLLKSYKHMIANFAINLTSHRRANENAMVICSLYSGC